MFDKFKQMLSGTPAPGIFKASPPSPVTPLPANWQSAWTTTDVDGRRVDLFRPPTTPRGAVLFLHGHGQVMLNQNPAFSQQFAEQSLMAVCPDGGKSWWLDVPCPDFQTTAGPFTSQRWLLDRLIPWFQLESGIESPRIALLGVSMGGQGALQLSYRHASKFPVVAAISPTVDFHQLYGSGIPLDQMFPDAETARQATVVLNLHPLSWPRHQFFCCDPLDHEWYEGCARLGMKLSSSGILHERDLDSMGGGHTWDYFNRMAPTAIGHIARSLALL